MIFMLKSTQFIHSFVPIVLNLSILGDICQKWGSKGEKKLFPYIWLTPQPCPGLRQVDFDFTQSLTGFQWFHSIESQEETFGNILVSRFWEKFILGGVGCRKNCFFFFFANLPSYPRYVCILRVNKWCLVILWYHPRWLQHIWPYIFTLWATTATQLWSKMAKNGLKQVFDNKYLHNLLFYTQLCSMDQQVVFNDPMVSPKVPNTFMTPYTYLMGHHGYSLVSKNGRKRLKTGFWRYLPP